MNWKCAVTRWDKACIIQRILTNRLEFNIMERLAFNSSGTAPFLTRSLHWGNTWLEPQDIMCTIECAIAGAGSRAGFEGNVMCLYVCMV